MKACCTTLR